MTDQDIDEDDRRFNEMELRRLRRSKGEIVELAPIVRWCLKNRGTAELEGYFASKEQAEHHMRVEAKYGALWPEEWVVVRVEVREVPS